MLSDRWHPWYTAEKQLWYMHLEGYASFITLQLGGGSSDGGVVTPRLYVVAALIMFSKEKIKDFLKSVIKPVRSRWFLP